MTRTSYFDQEINRKIEFEIFVHSQLYKMIVEDDTKVHLIDPNLFSTTSAIRFLQLYTGVRRCVVASSNDSICFDFPKAKVQLQADVETWHNVLKATTELSDVIFFRSKIPAPFHREAKRRYQMAYVDPYVNVRRIIIVGR